MTIVIDTEGSKKRTQEGILPEGGGTDVEPERLRPPAHRSRADRVTLLVSSREHARAGLVIATTAASLGMEASLFYTFWEDGRLADRPVEEGKSTEEPTRKGEDAPGSKELHRLAKQRGVRLVTLDVMAIREDDLCDDIEVGSTATYLAQASQSGLNLVL